MNQPYGIAFYPSGEIRSTSTLATPTPIVRFAYKNGDLKASGKPEKIADLPAGGGHWTRDLVFSQDGKQLFVASWIGFERR